MSPSAFLVLCAVVWIAPHIRAQFSIAYAAIFLLAALAVKIWM